MKQVIWILTCLLSIAGHSDAKQDSRVFAATLPNGVAVELIGVSYRSSGLSQPKRWWRPDGADLPDEPYRHSRRSTGAHVGIYVRDFALRITGTDDYSCVTYNSLGRSNVQPNIPLNEKNESVDGVLAFVCRFKDSQTVDTIRIGVSTEPWQKVEEWVDDAWHEHDHDNIVFKESNNPLILTWPRQKGRAVILEMVRTDVDDVQARRMLLFDRDDQIHEESPVTHGEGPGLIKEQYWFWNMRLEDMHRFEYQKRPYQWVEFRNVSLEPGHETDVEVAVLDVKDELARGLPVSEQDRNSLGYILHRLAQNLRFPAKGRATYRIEARNAQSQEPRLLWCEYAFDGVLYGFSVVEIQPGDFNVQWYFDGEKTTLYQMPNKAATIWEGRREMTPIYNLQQFFPSKTIGDLLTHKVELKGSGKIGGIPCSLLESIMSSKERLKVWVTKERDVYPLRIERYEYDNLRYLYEAENIKSWSGVPFPQKTTISWYRSDDALQHSLISSKVVSVESFSPNVEIAGGEFTPEFPPDTSVNTYTVSEQQASDFEPTRPAKRLRQFADIDIEFDIDQARGKMILVCFWDMNQRPSRNCITQLAKLAKKLKDKSVTVVAVQASKVEQAKLDEWIQTNDIAFPVGMIEGDEENTRFTWGVRSLPWLILTDKKRIVRAEGFGIEQLDEKLTETGSKTQLSMSSQSLATEVDLNICREEGLKSFFHSSSIPEDLIKDPNG
ncbi:MAG: redoxin domain-containing protein [Planctomycetes bacterium]|nr:redoxin domain-containing protein [Planctomycetota bacterium]